MADIVGQTDMGASAKEKAERDARWIGDYCDELTVSIALREWEKAVGLVEKGEQVLPYLGSYTQRYVGDAHLQEIPSLAARLTPLRNQLTAALLQFLTQPTNRKSAVTRLIALLVRLKAGPAARNTFLQSREDLIRKRVRMIRFDGHVGTYVGDLAVVVFTGIKHTADWFLSSFRENEVASCELTVELSAERWLNMWEPCSLHRLGQEASRVLHGGVQEAGLQLGRGQTNYRGSHQNYSVPKS